jgi:hypothetical protein
MPSMKKYKIRTGARTASKVQEKDLIRKAKSLKKNPDLILPKCVGHSRCYFDSIRKQVYRIQDFGDDERMLKKFSERGDLLARAYAATLLLAIEGKAPYLAPFKTPFGTVPFAFRGKTRKEKLVAVQNYDDPKWLLLGVIDVVKKKKLHVYSTKDGLVCTGREAAPPANFIHDTIKGLNVNLEKTGKIYTCPHLEPKAVRNQKQKGIPYLEVIWKSPDVIIGICERCSRKSKEHTLGTLAQRIADRNLTDDFDTNVILKPICKDKCDICEVEEPLELSKDLIKRYQLGEISDIELFSSHLDDIRANYEELDNNVYILENQCYGSNLKAFIKALNPTPMERRALNVVLTKANESAIFDRATPSKILGHYWSRFGKNAIFAITHDNKITKNVYKKFDINKTKASEILKEANIQIKKKTIISLLPTYTKLPVIAQFADQIARIYLTQGSDDTVRAIEKYRGGDTKVKSVAYAFLLALDRGKAKQWQYTQTEHDFAQFLKTPAEQLLNSEPKAYNDALQTLLSATGSTEKINPILKRKD